MQGLREQHKQDRRRQILVAGRQLIADGGVEALTMRTLAAASRLSVPTIYNLVGDRGAVIEALMDAGGERFEAELSEPSSDDPVAALLGAAGALATVMAEHRSVVAAVLGGPGTLALGPTRNSMFARFGATVEATLVQARRDDLIDRGANAAILRERIQGLAAGAVIGWALDHGDDARLRDDLAHSVLLVTLPYLDRERFDEVRAMLDRITRRLHRRRTRAATATAPRKEEAVGA